MQAKDTPEFLRNSDPFLEWAYATKFEFVFGEKGAIGLLIRWQSQEAATEAAQMRKDWPATVLVPDFYLPSGNRGARLVWAVSAAIADVQRFLEAIAPLAAQIGLAAPLTPSSGGAPMPTFLRSSGEVLAAVLDDGCAFANTRFRESNGTRVQWLWNQDANAPSGPTSLGSPGYGGQWSKLALDQVYPGLRSSQEEAYRDVGLVTLRRAASHGTHVMDLLAGDESWDLVFVQFPLAAIDDPSGVWLDRYALDGIHYAIECAGVATKKILINISWGPQTGPHDGSSFLEAAVEALVLEQQQLGRTLIVSLPAGNSFGSRAHAAIDHVAGGRCDWIVPPDGATPAVLELWWPKAVPLAEATLRVTPPGGPAVDITSAASAVQPTWWAKIAAVGQNVMARVIVHPTGGFGMNNGRHGRWRIAIVPSPQGPAGDVHVYVARADHNMGARRRAKASHLADDALAASRFVAPAARFDDPVGSVIRRSGTLNGIATGAATHVAAGYDHQMQACSPYSSAGPTRGARVGPDFACVSDRSDVRRGIRAAAVRSGTKTVLVGTSTAAPQLGRKIAKGTLTKVKSPLPPERVGDGLLVPDPGVLDRG